MTHLRRSNSWLLAIFASSVDIVAVFYVELLYVGMAVWSWVEVFEISVFLLKVVEGKILCSR